MKDKDGEGHKGVKATWDGMIKHEVRAESSEGEIASSGPGWMKDKDGEDKGIRSTIRSEVHEDLHKEGQWEGRHGKGHKESHREKGHGKGYKGHHWSHKKGMLHSNNSR